jgi:hypothetical protein
MKPSTKAINYGVLTATTNGEENYDLVEMSMSQVELGREVLAMR